MMKLPDYVCKAMDALNQAGYECYVVGGAVRSAVLHAPVHDYDLTTSALPEQMKQVFATWHTFDTGIRHGTLTVLSDHNLSQRGRLPGPQTPRSGCLYIRVDGRLCQT